MICEDTGEVESEKCSRPHQARPQMLMLFQTKTSGVKCSDDCLAKYNELKLKKTCRYILYKIEDQKEIVIDQIGDRNCTFDQFKTELENLEKSARYAVLDFESDSNKSHLLFISWIPDNASVRERMLYASSLPPVERKIRFDKGKLHGFASWFPQLRKADIVSNPSK
ncbi:Actin binding cofilin tropomyosin type [Echinococcus multilocularis]|uniref:Actin binding cofilin tropomyosin type n=1 Tax=Echinococcus multilocularis TaxID=6211 RepID=A0A068XZY6_ECHMU|nr:Actin binding cofilin tropomyosin type [Echinococcus multilocularis]